MQQRSLRWTGLAVVGLGVARTMPVRAESPPVVPEADAAAGAAEAPGAAALEVGVGADGLLVVDGRAVDRDGVRAWVVEHAGEGGGWRILRDPEARDADVYWVMSVLRRAGVVEVAVAEGEVVPPPPPAPVDAAPPAAAPAPVVAGPDGRLRPRGELRFDLAAMGITTDGGPDDLAFRVPRAILGFDGDLGEHLAMRATINASERHGDVSATLSDGEGGTQTVSIDGWPDGTAVRFYDVYLDLATGEAGEGVDLVVRAGVQAPIFSSRDGFDEPETGFYVVGPIYQSLPQVAGVVLSRDLGVSARARLADGRVAVAAMASNGADRARGEDNLGKDLSARVSVEVVPGLVAAASALTGERGGAGRGRLDAWDVELRWEGEGLRAMAEYLAGVDDPDVDDAIRPGFLGTQAAVAADLLRPPGAVERLAVAGRFGYFDPHADTMDADAWMLWNAALQAWWASRGRSGVLTGLGWQVLVPIDATQPVEHAVVAQARWAF